MNPEERFARLTNKALALNTKVLLIAVPADALDYPIRDFRMIGDPGDLLGQLDVIEAYLVGLSWRDIPRQPGSLLARLEAAQYPHP